MKRRIVLAYAGDVMTSVAIPWLSQHSGADVVAVTLDLGQPSGLEGVRDRALACGAVRAHVLDLREEFARDHLLPSLRAGVLCRDGYPQAAALARPLISKTLVEVARIENADTIAHGSTANGSAGSTIEAIVRDLSADLAVVAPVREGGMTPDAAAEYARRCGVPVPSVARSRDCVNLWGRSVPLAGGPDGAEVPEHVYALTRSASACPESPALVAVGFERGVPTTINGVPMPLPELVESLTLIAGQHGVGRLEWTGHRQDGTTHREVSEAPAALLLHTAHADVEASVLPQDLVAMRRELCPAYADVIRNGRWFTPLREALDAFHASAQSRMTGVSYLRLFKGEARVVAPEMASYA